MTNIAFVFFAVLPLGLTVGDAEAKRVKPADGSGGWQVAGIQQLA